MHSKAKQVNIEGYLHFHKYDNCIFMYYPCPDSSPKDDSLRVDCYQLCLSKEFNPFFLFILKHTILPSFKFN